MNAIIVCHEIYLNISSGIYLRVAYILLRALEGTAFIRGQYSFKSGIQLNKYGNRNLHVHILKILCNVLPVKRLVYVCVCVRVCVCACVYVHVCVYTYMCV